MVDKETPVIKPVSVRAAVCIVIRVKALPPRPAAPVIVRAAPLLAAV